MALAETAELAVRISLNDQLSRGITGIQGKLNGLNTGLGRTGKGALQMGAGFAKAGAVVAGFAATGVAAATKAAIDWEDAFAGVVKTVDEADLAAAGKTFRDLELALRKMSTEMPIAAVELAGIAEQAGALGIAGKDIEEFTRVVALIGTTTDVASQDAATALGQLSNVLGLTADDYDNFASALVDLGNKGASTESQILAITTRAGAAAKLAGIASDETLGWASAVANLGIEVEAGGSSIQKFFLESTKHVAAGGKELKLMAKTAGVSAKAFKKAFAKDASGALSTFIEGLGDLNQAAQLNLLEDLGFNDIRITRTLLGLAGDADGLTESLEIGTQAWKDNVAAQVEFDKRNKTVRSAITRLKNTFIDAAVTLGEGVAPAIGRAADELAKLVSSPDGAKQLAQIGKEIGEAIDGIDWKAVVSGARDFVGILRGAMSVAKAMFDVFNALPGEIKAATVGFLALNKLSGGLIGAGAGNIIGGLGETVARSGASRIPGIGKLFAQPVFVTNWPIGFGGPGGPLGGGGLKGLLKGALTIAIPAAVLVGVLDAVQGEINKGHQSQANANSARAQEIAGKSTPELRAAIEGLKNVPNALDPLQRVLYDLNANGVKTHNEDLIRFLQTELTSRERPVNDAALQEQRQGERNITQAITESKAATEAGTRASINHAARLEAKAAAGLAAQREGERSIGGKLDAVQSEAALARGQALVTSTQQAVADAIAYAQQVRAAQATENAKVAVDRAKGSVDSTRTAVYAIGRQITGAVRGIRLNVTTVNRTTVVQQRYGRQSGSRYQGRTAQ